MPGVMTFDLMTFGLSDLMTFDFSTFGLSTLRLSTLHHLPQSLTNFFVMVCSSEIILSRYTPSG